MPFDADTQGLDASGHDDAAATPRHILFVTREPLLQDLGGSTTYALALLRQLQQAGHSVTILVTHAASRSVRPWFVRRGDPPAGVEFLAPGYVRVGAWYLRPWSARAWARIIVRGAARRPWLRVPAKLAMRVFGEDLDSVAWDLSEPTDDERAYAIWTVDKLKSDVVIVNYAFWGPLLSDPAMRTRRTVILMHDLLSARVKRLQDSGLPLDCPPITEATELAWLDQADVLLAAQQREAERVQPHVHGTVLVPPMAIEAVRAPLAAVPARCLFVGSKILPNYDGLVWFLQQVWPLVLAARPDAKLAVCGTICIWLEDRAPAYDRASVELLHFVPSLADEYARASLCVVPLLVGSGIKIKLLEALAYGRAVVTTPVGAQGLEEWAGTAFSVAEDAASFAAETLRLLGDSEALHRTEAAGAALAETAFSARSSAAKAYLRAVAGA